MSESLRDRDLRRLLDVIEAARSTEVAAGFPTAVLDRAQALVACDTLVFVELDTVNQLMLFGQSVDEDAYDEDADGEAFWRNYWDCLPWSYPDVSGDDRSITTISDFYTEQQWHETGMYIDYFAAHGLEHEAMLCLTAPTGSSRRLIFFRGRGSDFDGRDRLLLALLRPHLNDLYQQLERRRQPTPALTPRQWQLLRLVATGQTNAEIAHELVVSNGTVRKHLENIFARLNVTNRTAAIARAFPTTPY